MDISKKGIRISTIMVLLFCFSCTNSKRDIKEKTKLYENHSKAIIDGENYCKIYNAINDSLHIWKLNGLGNQSIWFFDYKLDSVLCFNSKKNRLITAFLVRCNQNDCVQDDIHFFTGQKLMRIGVFLREQI